MDISPLLHAACSACVQVIVGFITGNWMWGAAIGCTFFIAREHTQAEYRWITHYGKGKRANMPWWGGLDYHAWDMPSLLDWLVPVFVCGALYSLFD